ncbi:MAG: hypothetical protein ACC742_16375, partial [Thermoanaerobaculales bacterium]
IHLLGDSPVKDRIHIVLPAEEKERYRAIAEREGTTMSHWMREAVREKATKYDVDRKLDTVEDLESFFQECDQLHQGTEAAEPDWEEHERLIQGSRAGGLEAQ